uniref:Uncharacterized protein n=1 Tax=Leersia perrieri TaxID=77586 RepID=A0A0D9W769_9ORYZ
MGELTSMFIRKGLAGGRALVSLSGEAEPAAAGGDWGRVGGDRSSRPGLTRKVSAGPAHGKFRGSHTIAMIRAAQAHLVRSDPMEPHAIEWTGRPRRRLRSPNWINSLTEQS